MLIFNALVRHQSVYLPEIGSLEVVCDPPRMQKRRVLTPPRNRVTFNPHPAPYATNILTLIESSSGKKEEKCLEIYDRWFSETQQGEGWILPSVGNIHEGVFYPTEELNRIMNPAGSTSRTLRPRSRMTGWWIGSGVALLLIAAAAWIIYAEPFGTSAPATAPAPVAEATAPAAVDTTTQVATSPTATTATATTSTAPKATTTTTSPTSSSTQGISKMSRKAGYYAVIGVYSTQQNAERFVAECRKKAPSMHYLSFTMNNGKIVVFLKHATNRTELERYCREVRPTFPEIWIL